MRPFFSERLEVGRLRSGYYASLPGKGYGAFVIAGPCGCELKIIASDGIGAGGWQHVSVSTARRPPNWQEMCFVKQLFWDDEETVIQFHPAESAYVNNHPHCLHLWKPPYSIELPPEILIGRASAGDLSRAFAQRRTSDGECERFSQSGQSGA